MAQEHDTTVADTNDGNQRDLKGRFAKGNRIATGNPFARQTAELRQAVLDAVSTETIRNIVAALTIKAEAGIWRPPS